MNTRERPALGAVCTRVLEKVTKPSLTRFGLHPSTPRQIVYTWRISKSTVILPSSAQPSGISPRAKCVIVIQVTKDPGVTSKPLKVSLANINVHDCPPSGEHWTTMVCMAGLEGESDCSSKGTLLCCGSTWSEQFMQSNPPTSQSWSHSVKVYFPLLLKEHCSTEMSSHTSATDRDVISNIGSFSLINKWPSAGKGK